MSRLDFIYLTLSILETVWLIFLVKSGMGSDIMSQNSHWTFIGDDTLYASIQLMSSKSKEEMCSTSSSFTDIKDRKVICTLSSLKDSYICLPFKS